MDSNLCLLTVEQIAQFLNVSPKTIYYWVGRFEIPFVKVGRHLRFQASEVTAHFAKKTEENRPACLSLPHLLASKKGGFGRSAAVFDKQERRSR